MISVSNSEFKFRVKVNMMFARGTRAQSSAPLGSTGPVHELREAVSLATDSLNKLNGEFQVNRDNDLDTTLQHLHVQESTAKRVEVRTSFVHSDCEFAAQLTSQESIKSCESNIGKCVELLERLERAEELALKIKNLRDTVDRIAKRI